MIALTKSYLARKVYRAGIVGCGRIASLFDRDPKRSYVATHAGAYTRSRNVELVAACDIDREKLENFGRRWRIKKLYHSFDEMLSNEKLDLISLCTWPESHFDLARKAVDVGVKAIFCEKPITTLLSEADELIELCRKKGVILAVNHSRRWDEGHQKIKRFLAAGKLGKIHHVNCYYTAGISNTGTHLFDLLRLFLGEAKWVYASSLPTFGDKDPTLSGQIFFENETLVSVAGLDVKDYLIFEIDFYGTKGRLRIIHSGFKAEYWKVGTSPYFSGYKELRPTKINFNLNKKTMMLSAISDLTDCLQKHRDPLCSGEDGRKVLEIVCAFKKSFRTGLKVSIPLEDRNLGIDS